MTSGTGHGELRASSGELPVIFGVAADDADEREVDTLNFMPPGTSVSCPGARARLFSADDDGDRPGPARFIVVIEFRRPNSRIKIQPQLAESRLDPSPSTL